MGHPVDEHVGLRIRQRRWMLGITQQALAEDLGITFQQVQKYEIGANRVSASRLWAISRLLSVPVEFFFEGLSPAASAPATNAPAANAPAANAPAAHAPAAHAPAAPPPAAAAPAGAGPGGATARGRAAPALSDLPLDRDAAALLRSFSAIPAAQRRRLLDLARSLTDPAA